MHPMVGDGHSLKLKVPHPVDLQLEGQGRLQVTVDAILSKLQTIHHHVLITCTFWFMSLKITIVCISYDTDGMC